MTKGSTTIGKQVVVHETGTLKESVYDLVVDPGTGCVAGFLLESPGWFTNARLLPFSAIQIIGEDAILIESEAELEAVERPAERCRLVGGDYALKNIRLMSDAGTDLGYVVDVVFDEEDGHIQGYEVAPGIPAESYAARTFVPVEGGIEIGEDVAFVPAAAEEAAKAKVAETPPGPREMTEKMADMKQVAGTAFEAVGTPAAEHPEHHDFWMEVGRRKPVPTKTPPAKVGKAA